MARAVRALLAAATVTAATACSLVGADTEPRSSKDVVLVTHDSFVLPKRLLSTFEAQSGYHLVVTSGVLAAGQYDVTVYAHSMVSSTFNQARVVRVTVQ